MFLHGTACDTGTNLASSNVADIGSANVTPVESG
jgi:hypothetical protein